MRKMRDGSTKRSENKGTNVRNVGYFVDLRWDEAAFVDLHTSFLLPNHLFETVKAVLHSQ